MGEKIKLGGTDYAIDSLTEHAKTTVNLIKFTDDRIKELKNMRVLLQRAKNSYVENLKREVLSNKAGFLFDTEE